MFEQMGFWREKQAQITKDSYNVLPELVQSMGGNAETAKEYPPMQAGTGAKHGRKYQE